MFLEEGLGIVSASILHLVNNIHSSKCVLSYIVIKIAISQVLAMSRLIKIETLK